MLCSQSGYSLVVVSALAHVSGVAVHPVTKVKSKIEPQVDLIPIKELLVLVSKGIIGRSAEV